MKKSLLPAIILTLLAFASEATAQIQLSFSSVEPSCHGYLNGSVSVFASGGSGPYTYAWSTGQTTQSILGIGAGIYTVTVTDAASSTASGTAVVSEPTAIMPAVTAVGLNCDGTSGTLTATGFGGTPPYSYSWGGPNSSTTRTVAVIAPGTYIVTVTDAKGCQGQASYFVPSAISVEVVAIDIPCSTNPTGGSANAVVTGGAGPYAYLWSNGEHTASINNLSQGTYFCTVTSANGCSATDSDQVDIPPPLVVTLTWLTPACGGNNGSATVQASGGTPPYTYTWTGGVPNGPAQIGLAPGEYYVCTMDSNHCQKDLWVIIPPTTSLNVQLVVNSATCLGIDDATATAVASPPGSGYVYQWNILPPDSNVVQVTGLAANTLISVTVTDPVSGCSGTATATVGAHSNIDVSVTDTDILCAGGSGNAIAVASNGTPQYTYTWFSNGVQIGDSSSIFGLNAGAYVVSVVDSLGCKAQGVANIGILSDPHALIHSDSVLICGDSVSVVQFTNLSYDTYNNITSLEWTVTGSTVDTVIVNQNQIVFTLPVDDTIMVQLIATSGLGCSDTTTLLYNVPGYPHFTLSLDSTTITCAGDSIGINVIGLDSSYTLVWNPAVTLNPNPLHVLVSPSDTTTYVLTATDGNACTSSDSITIAPLHILFELLVCDSLIETCSDSALLCASTNIPATIVWTQGNIIYIGDSITVAVGADTTIWTVTAISADSCILTDEVVVIGYDLEISLDSNAVHIICEGDSLPLWVIVTPYSDSLTYQWSVTPPAILINPTSDTAILTGPAGNYVVSVIVNNGFCFDTLEFPVQILDSFNLEAHIVADFCNGLEIHGFNPPGIGGTWDFGDGSTSVEINPFHTYAAVGQYLVTFSSSLLSCANPWDSLITVILDTLKVEVTATDIVCAGGFGSACALTSGGTPPYSYTWYNSIGDEIGNQNCISNLGAGSYSVTVKDALGCTAQGFAEIGILSDPHALIVDSAVVLFCGDSLSTVQFTSLSYDTYSTIDSLVWTVTGPGIHIVIANQNPIIVQIPPDVIVTVQLVATSALGCSDTTTLVYSVPGHPDITLLLDSTSLNCMGDSVRICVIGGNASYEYHWEPVVTPDPSNPLCFWVSPSTTTAYSVTVTDENGCTATASIEIPPSDSLFILTLSDTLIQTCEATATFSASTNLPSNIVWTDPNGMVIPGNPITVPATPTTTIYTATATTPDSCVLVGTVSVTGYGIEISLDSNAVHIICEGDSLPLWVIVTPYSDSLTYQWSVTPPAILINPTSDTAILTGTAGNYVVSVIAGNGFCFDTLEFPVQILDSFNLEAHIVADFCNGLEIRGFNPPGIGGSWDFGDGSTSVEINPVHTYAAEGQYLVTFSSSLLSCATAWDSLITVTQDTLKVEVTTTDIVCAGGFGSACALASDGTPPYSYTWYTALGDSLGNQNCLFNLLAGTYSVIVTDALGCTEQGTANIGILSEPHALIIGDTVLICGDSLSTVQFSSNSFDTYNTIDSLVWTVNASGINLVFINQDSIIVQVPVGEVIFVQLIAISALGCPDTTLLLYHVPGYPDITLSLDSTVINCVGDSIGINVIGGDLSYTLVWSPAVTPNPDLLHVLVSPTDTTTYVLTATDGNVCTSSDSITIAPLDILFELLVCDTLIETCSDFALLCASTNIPATIVWTQGNSIFIGDSITVAVSPGTTIWTVTAISADSCILTDEVVVIGYGLEVSLDGNTGNIICVGDSLALSVIVTPFSDSLTYQWSATPPATLIITGPGTAILTGPAGNYVISVIAGNGFCFDTLEFPVQILDSFNLEAHIVTDFCNGLEIHGFNPPGIGGTWDFGDGSTSVEINPDHIYAAEGPYLVTFSSSLLSCATPWDSLITVTQDTLKVEVTATDIVCAGGFGSVCALASGGTPPYSYAWYNAIGDSLGNQNCLLNLVAGAYSVILTDALGCTEQGTANIGILSEPHAVILGDSALICGDSLSTVQFTSLSSDTYSSIDSLVWTVAGPGINMVFINQDTIIVQIPVGEDILVQLMAISALGCPDTTSLLYHVPGYPDFTLSLDAASLNCTGDSMRICVVGGDINDEYVWSPTVTQDPSNPLCVLVNPAATTIYMLTATDGNVCTATASIEIPGSDSLFQLILSDTLIQTCADSVTLSASTLPSSIPSTIVWTDQNGLVIPGNPIIVPATSTPSTYTATATSLTTEVCVLVETVTVIGYSIEVSLDPAVDSIICEGDSLPLSVIVTPTAATLTYDWSVNAPATLSDTTAANPILTGPAGNYTVTVIVTNVICSDTLEFPVQILDSFNLEGHIIADLCNGLEVHFFNDTITGTWDFGDGSPISNESDPVHVYASAGAYQVVFTPTLLQCTAPWDTLITVYADTLTADIEHLYVDCALQAVIQFNGIANHTGIISWDWVFSNGMPMTSTEQNPVITFVQEGVYLVKLTVTDSNHCTEAAWDTVRVDIQLDIIDSTLSICKGDSIQLNPVGIDTLADYTWSSNPFDPTLEVKNPNPVVAPMVPTVYTVIIEKGLCTVNYIVSVTFKTAGEVNLPNDTLVCSNDPIPITAQTNGLVALEWSVFPNFIPPFATTQTVLVPPGTYYVRTTGVECPDMDSIKIEMRAAEIQAVPTDLDICQGEEAALMFTNLIPDQTLVCYWGPGMPTGCDLIVSPDVTTTYTVTVTNQFGCTATLSFTVNVTTVSVDAEAAPDVVSLDDPTTILTATPGGNGTVVTYEWTPPETLSNPDSSQTTATPTETTIYTVTVTTDDGCIATDTVTVRFLDTPCTSPFVFVPKAFTPNHDQKNDYFMVRADGMTALRFVVWDRWGEIVYETDDPAAKGWDGTFKGKENTGDVFAWYVWLTCGNGDIYQDKGNVTLLK